MSEKEPSDLDFVFFVSIPLGILLLLILFQIDWPSTPQEWSGGKAPAELFALIVTPLGGLAAIAGLIVNARSTRRALQHSNRAMLLGTFQKAADLLSSEKASTQIAGVSLMDQCSAEAPNLAEPAIRAVRTFVSDGTRADIAAALVRVRKPPEQREALTIESSLSVAHALRVLPAMAARAPGTLIDGQLVINGMLFATLKFHDLDLTNLSVRNTVVDGCSFHSCKFSNVFMGAKIGDAIDFTDCSFSKCDIVISHGDTGKAVKPGDYLVRFRNCVFDEKTRINGLSGEEWLSKLRQAAEAAHQARRAAEETAKAAAEVSAEPDGQAQPG